MQDIIGTSVFRSDAPDKVRGKAVYTADIMMEGTLHVSLARSSAAHAVLKGIRVPDLPDGCFVFTAKDLAQNFIPSIFSEQPVLAFGNTSSDFAMAEYTVTNNRYRSLGFMLCCDDLERENGNLEKAQKMVEDCREHGWIAISMKNDWTTIYGDHVTYLGAIPFL